MNKKGNKLITTLLANPQFVRWVRSPDKRQDLYWSRWVYDNPAHKNEFQKAIEIAGSLAMDKEPKDLFDYKKESLEAILKASPTIRAVRNDPEKRTVRPIVKHLLKIAAILVMALGIALTANMYLHEINNDEVAQVRMITKENPAGQKIKFQLPDKSIVWLNAQGKLTFPEKFDDNRRIVTLTGEAFFEVQHDASAPFEVIVGDLITTVLGTSFNVRSFPEDEQTAISLLTGKVKVTNPSQKSENLLNPGEQVLYDEKNGKTMVRQFSQEEIISWKDGVLFFKNNTFEEVKHRLERWYGVEIQVENAPAEKWEINGEFRNQSIERVLERLAFAENFSFSVKSKSISIKF